MTCTLLTVANGSRGWLASITAAYAGVKLTERAITWPLDESVLKLNPLGRMPILELPDGKTAIYEGIAIAYYLALQAGPNSNLLGRGDVERAQVIQWLSMGEDDIWATYASVLLCHTVPHVYRHDEAREEEMLQHLDKVMRHIDAHLRDHTYLVGERLTVADIAIVSYLAPLLAMSVPPATRERCPHLMRHFNTCVNKAPFRAVIGEVEFTEQSLFERRGGVLVPLDMPSAAAKPNAGAEKAGDAAPRAEDAPAAGAGAEKKAKPKHPLDELPPPSMVMDDWKRMYSNNDTKTVAMPWLWEHLKSDEYSLWYCKYKYNDELSKTFMAANLITGWFQRVEHRRKYLFGNVLVFGKSNAGVEISGVWLLRGGELPPNDPNMMGNDESDDATYYEWRRLDVDNADDRRLAEDYFAWEGAFDGNGRAFSQGKTFK